MTALAFVDVYASLRRLGTVVLSVEERGRISGLRRRAAADGLAIVTHRESTKGLSKSQARNRPTTVNLVHPDRPTLICSPDVCTCMTEDLRDGLGERVVTHSSTCYLHPES